MQKYKLVVGELNLVTTTKYHAIWHVNHTAANKNITFKFTVLLYSYTTSHLSSSTEAPDFNRA